MSVGPGYLGRGPLLAAIRFYQRRVSGRGPLANVACTFAQSESCSCHGLRVASTARNLGEALSLIRARLRRCREASLYRVPGGLVWGELYDADESRWQEELTYETAPTRTLLCRSAALVARQQDDPARCRRFVQRIRGAKDPWPRLRDGQGIKRLFIFKMLNLLVIFLCCVALVGLALSGALAWAAVGGLVVLGVAAALRVWRRYRRLTVLRDAARFGQRSSALTCSNNMWLRKGLTR